MQAEVLCPEAVFDIDELLPTALQLGDSGLRILFLVPQSRQGLAFGILVGALYQEFLYGLPVVVGRRFLERLAYFHKAPLLLLLLFCHVELALVIADVLLHGGDVGVVREVADVFGDELLDVVNVPHGQDALAVVLVGVVYAVAGTEASLQLLAKLRLRAGTIVRDEHAFGESASEGEEIVAMGAVLAAREDDALHEAAVFDVVVAFADDVGVEFLANARTRMLP